MPEAARLYQRFPYVLRVAAASARGYHLRSWRYGPETGRLVGEALERDGWSAAEWERWRRARLRILLGRAATGVPHYREHWSSREHGDKERPWQDLQAWPVLRKEFLRKDPKSFLLDGTRVRSLFEVHTSGSTAKPLTLWRSRQTNIQWYAIWEARVRHWNGLSREDRWAVLGGQLVSRFEQRKPPFWVWNAALRQLYMSSYHLSPKNVPAYLDAMERYRVSYAVGYASSLHALAAQVLESGLRAPMLKLVVSNAEPLWDHQRRTIETAFRCPVRDSYGMTEIVAAASECQFQAMHVWPDVGIIEVLDAEEDRPAKAGEPGRLVCTGLLSETMPLVRYEVGDVGALGDPGQTCECGRRLPILKGLEGRMDDTVITPDGRRVGRLDPAFKADLRIREAQIIQESLDSLRVRLVQGAGFDDRDAAALVRRLKDRVGDMKISLESVEEIPRSANGKFRAVISTVGRGVDRGFEEAERRATQSGESGARGRGH